MDKAEEAYEAARAEIARVKAKSGDVLDLRGSNLRALSYLPPKIADIRGLRVLFLSGTKITDFTPLAEISGLRRLYLHHTPIADLSPLAGLTELLDLTLDWTLVRDLRPIAELSSLGTHGFPGLRFSNTLATAEDNQLAELSTIERAEGRARQTLAYLRSLPPWPEPYTPAATPDGSPPKPIGGVPEREKIKTAQTQIQHLIRNATVTRVTAQTFAAQIEDALRGVPATHGNELAEPLQTMQEFANALRNLAPSNEPVSDPLQRAQLELRISQLEAIVDRLTRQLADETKAREAAEALARKEGLIALHNKAFAAEAAKWNARFVYIGVPSAAFYFLGAENPLAVLLSKVMAGAIK